MNMCSWRLRCALDSELAAAVVEHSVAIRVTSPEDLQLVSTRRVLHRLLRICKAYDVVVDNWVSIPFTVGAPFRLNNEKLGAKTGDLAMTYKLAVAAVGLCRHVVRSGSGFSWEWSNGNELWILVVVRNLFARCGNSSCFGLNRSCGTAICRSRRGRVLRQEEVKTLNDAAPCTRLSGIFVTLYLLVLHFTHDGEEQCLCFHQAWSEGLFVVHRTLEFESVPWLCTTLNEKKLWGQFLVYSVSEHTPLMSVTNAISGMTR